jgi:subtilisin-like proprotein convertase family protein
MLFFGLLPALALAACSSDSGTPDDPGSATGKPEDDGKTVDGKAEAWNSTNNPDRFEVDFIYKYDDLKGYTNGLAEQTPWPSDYWSYVDDSINVRFHGAQELSPAEKYDKAFNHWEPNMSVSPVDLSTDCGKNDTIENTHDDYYAQLGPAALWQHKNKGNFKARNGKDDDNDGEIDECRGDDYDGIESWWGLCHAWTPAAILEPEPLHPATINGVEFTVSDIKALLIAQYDRSSALMLGGRCNEKELERDATGRITKNECRDANAGAFYVVATNMLGKDKRAFAEDRTAAYQVWNQPVLGYDIRSESVLTEEQALQKLGKTTADGKYAALFASPEAVAWRYVKMDVKYITEASNSTEGALTPNIGTYTRIDHYEMVIELDAAGNIVGGEWIGYSQDTHPDFLWLPLQSHGGNPSINTANVRHLLELSRKTDEPAPTESVTEFGGDANVAIPDNNPNGVTHTITVNDDVTIGALKVKLGVEHTYIGDLKVVLAKDGTEVVLHDRTGGGTNDINTTIDVSEFNGMSAKGTWTLKISDHANRDTGTLKNLTLSVSTGEGSSTSERSYVSTQVMSIPDNNETGVTSVITVPDEGSIKGLKLTLDVAHTYVGDLTVLVEHGGQKQVLHSREGGSTDNIKKTYTLTSFNGAPVKGDWRLLIKDEAGQDTGKLNTWTLVAEL